MFGECYRNRRVLLTGHTGFKGSWLALWLKDLGAEVIGLALAPDTTPNHWDLLKLDVPQHMVDIRDAGAVSEAVKKIKPSIVFHLAAQSLVRRSYGKPAETWETNVMGTINLMEACRDVPEAHAIVIVTTDKCYENKESLKGYKEEDRLGGHDPYSASKAAAELAVVSYRDALFKDSKMLIATARSGNVIGGGDWAEDRLIPDLARAQNKGEPLIIRSPYSVRPWQHVLEPLAGYLQLGQKLIEAKEEFEGAWNFGPEEKDSMTVSDILELMRTQWPGIAWAEIPDAIFHEAKLLQLDSTKACKNLGWRPVLSMEQQISMTAEWYKAFQEKKAVISADQLQTYMNAAKNSGAAWA